MKSPIVKMRKFVFHSRPNAENGRKTDEAGFLSRPEDTGFGGNGPTRGWQRTERSFGTSLGTRESRKITGRTNLTGNDVRNQGRFEDAIGFFPEFLDAYGVVGLPTSSRYFQVPYGIMVPQQVENLLVAGRQMMCRTVTGQAAGVAAAAAIKEGVN
jgi:FAD dependent oxidoreductase